MSSEEISLYFPTKETLNNAKVKSYDNFYKEASENPLGFWETTQRSFIGFNHGIQFR